MLYTRLSERTVRTALDRLESARMTMPCAPEIIAARMRRADRRPQGRDLDVSLIRDDLTYAEIAGLKRQFPGLRERIAAARSAQTLVFDRVQQQLHPALSKPVDNPPDRVQLTHSRGAAVAPEPSIEPPAATISWRSTSAGNAVRKAARERPTTPR